MPLLQQIRLENLLSFGPETGALQLRPLNVLIGPNGVGKSNFVEAINLLRQSPTNIADAVRVTGGVRDIVWNQSQSFDSCRISAWIHKPKTTPNPIYHSISFNLEDQQFRVDNESVVDHKPQPSENDILYRGGALPMIRSISGAEFTLDLAPDHHQRSILSLMRDVKNYPEITFLAEQYQQFRIYRDWAFGRKNPARLPQRADGRTDYLESDCSNLGMILNRIRRDPVQKAQLLECLNDLYPDIRDVDVSIEGGSVQVFLVEGTHAIPATRLSDGTLRYLCLLAILLHPTPPPLICIEEPELGLHPDVMPAMTRLLKQASERTQLIVTTHSEVLVDAFGDTPEDVVVCEKHDGCTTFNRLDGEQLKVWLKDYSLGNLWRSGQIGGNRW